MIKGEALTCASFERDARLSGLFSRLLGLPSLREGAEDSPSDSYWVLAAKATLRDLLDQHHADLTAVVIEQARADLAVFEDSHAPVLARFTAARQAAAVARGDKVARLAVLAGELHLLLPAVR